MAKSSLKIIPLGGLGEIGKNMMVLEYDKDIIVIDCGVLFPEEDMPGISLVIPDISYLLERRSQIKAILITHGHEDHTGALPFILPQLNVPVYAPRLAHGLISVKLKGSKITNGPKLEVVEPGKPIRLGHFRVEFFPVCHSIPDAMGLAIETPIGTVIHTGDFKIDHTPVDGKPTDMAKLAKYGDKGTLLLFSDSTYAELPGYTSSEQIVGEALDRAIGDADGRVLVATFASLISRIQQVINAATKHGRKVGIVGRSMVDNVKMSAEMGYLKVPDGILLSLKDIRRLPPEQTVLVTTGSQGEPTSALVRMANRDHRDIEIIPGDTVIISATAIPGNENAVSRSIDNLFRQGAKVLYDKIALVHVHGHSSQEELKIMLNLVRPKFFVPVHGEYRHLLAHAAIAKSMGVPEKGIFVIEDGDVLEIEPHGGNVVGNIPAGHIFVDGKRLIPSDSPVIRERKGVSRDGIIIVVVALNKSTGTLAQQPELVSSGFMDGEDSLVVFQKATEAVQAILGRDPTHPFDRTRTNTIVKEAVGKVLLTETGRRPIVVPISFGI